MRSFQKENTFSKKKKDVDYVFINFGNKINRKIRIPLANVSLSFWLIDSNVYQ
jgi:hypothetical protein